MHSFFLTIVLISAASGILILYYFLKQLIEKKKQRQKLGLIRKKLYEDDRALLQSRMRSLVSELKTGRLQWIVLSSRADKESKLEITYSLINDKIEIKDRARNRNRAEIENLSKLGAETYLTRDEINLTSAPLNSKIITDIIYFIIEEIFNTKPAQNLKILTSGK